MDDEQPDTRHLVLKPKEIVPTDRPSFPGDGNAISVQLIHKQNRIAEERALKGRRGTLGRAPPRFAPVPPPIFKAKDIRLMDPPSHPGDEMAISVPVILLENRIAEERSGWGRIKNWKRRKSRRIRDFVVFVGGIDLLVVIVIRSSPSLASVMWGASIIALFTSMMVWTLFVVMDDY